jgi:hypothetical protein
MIFECRKCKSIFESGLFISVVLAGSVLCPSCGTRVDLNLKRGVV